MMIPEKVPRERSQYLSRPDVRVYLQKYGSFCGGFGMAFLLAIGLALVAASV